jgi:hypothetical protein
MKRVKLEITVEVDGNEFEDYEEEDILNYCCNVLEENFESKDPTGLEKKLVWKESEVKEE